MKALGVFIFLLFSLVADAQVPKGLNKKEIGQLAENLLYRIDSFDVALKNLTSERLINITKINELESLIKKQKVEISGLSTFQTDLTERLNRSVRAERSLLDSVEKVTSRLLEAQQLLSIYSDSLSVLAESYKPSLITERVVADTASVVPVELSGSTDFLNRFFVDSKLPLDGKYEFVLSKIIVGQGGGGSYNDYSTGFTVYGGRNRYNDDNELIESAVYVPEVLLPKDLIFYKGRRAAAYSYSDISGIVEEISFSEFTKTLPSFQLIKNKLLTLQYSSLKEEDFLFNRTVKAQNNGRTSFLWQLASEQVKNDGTKNSENDIVWTQVVIGDQSYLALTAYQVARIGVVLLNNDEILSSHGDDERVLSIGRYNSYHSVEGGFYIGRKVDRFMGSSVVLNARNLVYLFKLKK